MYPSSSHFVLVLIFFPSQISLFLRFIQMSLIRVNILEQSKTCYIVGLIDCTRGEENSITKGRFHTVRCLMGLPLLPHPLIKPGFLILND